MTAARAFDAAVAEAVAQPVAQESRISFGIQWYVTEAAALAAGFAARTQTINGGWYHGQPCGRDSTFDRTVEGVRLYAVVVA